MLGKVYRTEGLRVLFSGIVPRVTWISIGGAIFFGTYEKAKRELASRFGGDAPVVEA